MNAHRVAFGPPTRCASEHRYQAVPCDVALATRLRAPLVLGHAGLERLLLLPWLESDGERVWGARGLATAWPELASFPAVRLEVECG